MSDRQTEQRPVISTIRTGVELKRWYWLKEELVEEARRVGVKSAGGKFTILERIAHFLDTGETVWPQEKQSDKKVKPKSKFDWHKEPLTPQTVITDSYKNSQNVRRFFKEHADPKFNFSIAFMDWMKANQGKTLADAVAAYKALKEQAAKPGFKTEIRDHNQFNQYTRDFMADNPDATLAEVRRIWALKRALPSENGRHVYERSDLELG